jgi:serine/threonine protein kinase
MVGQTISHYKVLGKLGGGGMGVVYEAEDTLLCRRVALKFLPQEMAQDAQSLERFQREARAASALNHPNICTVHAIEQHEWQHFIVMERLEGQTLAQMIGHEPIEMEKLLTAAMQIADALESANAKGIVHRDIKPANIFITNCRQAKVLDFGLAKMGGTRGGAVGKDANVETQTQDNLNGLTVPGTTLGTVAYMSPEQARGQLADARTDLFSLGTVLYQMATGVLPFQGDTSAVIYEAILNRDPVAVTEANPAVPAELGRVIDKALEKDRNLRCQTATDLKTDLARLKRDLESGRKRTADSTESRGESKQTEKSIAVLYFENISGVKEDEYFRDGITEDIITELSKIKGLSIFSRSTVLAYRDKRVTPAQIGQQLVVRAIRPRDEGCVRSPGRDRAEHRGGTAHHALAAGAGRPGRQADRKSAGLRPLFARKGLRAAHDATGPGVCAADVRKRSIPRPQFRAGLRGDRQRVRTDALQLRTRSDLAAAGGGRLPTGR